VNNRHIATVRNPRPSDVIAKFSALEPKIFPNSKSEYCRSGKHVTDRFIRSRNLSFEDLQVVQSLSLRPPMTPVIDVFIQGIHKRFLIDTGASVSLVQPGTSNTPLCQTTLKPQGVTGEALHVLGTQAIEFTIGNRNLRMTSLSVNCQYR
jgi:hypothetical protein